MGFGCRVGQVTDAPLFRRVIPASVSEDGMIEVYGRTCERGQGERNHGRLSQLSRDRWGA